MFQPLDGPSVQDTISVTTSQVEAKVGASPLTERKVVTIQPLDGQVRVTFVSGTVATKGLLIRKEQVASFEASESQSIYLITTSGTTTVVVIERA